MNVKNILFNDGSDDEDVTPLDEALAEAESTDPEESTDPSVDEPAEDADLDDADPESDDEEPEDDEPEPAAALRFANQQEAERAYAEAQAEMNRLRNQQWQQQGQRPEPEQPQIDYAAVAQQNPLQAFELAMEHDPQVATQLIARVQTDSQRHMTASIIAAEEGNEEMAAIEQNRAYNAQLMAQQMTEAKIRTEQEAQLAPEQERRFQEDLHAAARAASAPFGGLDATQAQAVEAYVLQNEHIMGDWSPARMQEGFALAIGRVTGKFGPTAATDPKIAELEAQIATLKANRKDAATGGGGGRKAPKSSDDPDQAEADRIAGEILGSRSGQKSGMGLLFNL